MITIVNLDELHPNSLEMFLSFNICGLCDGRKIFVNVT